MKYKNRPNRILAALMLLSMIACQEKSELVKTFNWKGPSGTYNWTIDRPTDFDIQTHHLMLGDEDLYAQPLPNGTLRLFGPINAGENHIKKVAGPQKEVAKSLSYSYENGVLTMKNAAWQFRYDLNENRISVAEKKADGSWLEIVSPERPFGVGAPAMYNYDIVIPIDQDIEAPQFEVLEDNAFEQKVKIVYNKVVFRGDTVGVGLEFGLKRDADLWDVAIETLRNKRQSIKYALCFTNLDRQTPVIQSSRGQHLVGYTFGPQGVGNVNAGLALIASIPNIDRKSVV